jgi:hypothetical protein
MQSDIGNDSWTNGGRYKNNKRSLGRLSYVYDKVNTEALSQIATSLRDNVPCRVHEKFSAGDFNLVLLVEFEDGVRWVARLRMPRIEAFDLEGNVTKRELLPWTPRDTQSFTSEIATMRFVRYTFPPRPLVSPDDLTFPRSALKPEFLSQKYLVSAPMPTTQLDFHG